MPRLFVQSFRLSIAVVAVLLSSSFARSQEPACPPDLSGHWRGIWESCASGHRGPLAARFEKMDDCHYLVRFHGRAFKAFPFYYSVTFTVTGYEGDTVFLTASRHLPIFGNFQCSASANYCRFEASYSAASDNGQFHMDRK